jgi:hypothetical protein
MLPQSLHQNIYAERDHLKKVLYELILLTMFNKDSQSLEKDTFLTLGLMLKIHIF